MSPARAYGPIIGVIALFALVPLAGPSNTLLNGMVLALLIALAGSGWNLLGALLLHELGELTRAVAGGVPGIDTALFGALLILVIAFARDGVQGVIARLFARMTRKAAPPAVEAVS